MGPVGINATALSSPLTGVGQYTLQLVRELQGLLAQPPWLFDGARWQRQAPDPPADGTISAGLRVRRALPFGYFAARALQQWRFTRGVRAHGIRLYHEPNFLAFDFPGPSVVTVHDLSWIRFPETHPSQRVSVMNAAMPRVVAAAAQVIVDSEFVRGEVIGHYRLPPERVTAIPLGVGAGFRPVPAAECAPILEAHGLRFGEYLLSVGTFEPRKNLLTTLAAYARLDEAQRRRYPLVVAGMEGWGSRRFPGDIAAMIARGEVRLVGYVAKEALPALYSGARLLLYPSLYEGFGLPPLEAMACGTPVIVSTRGSLPEVVGDAGIQVEPLDEAALAASVRSLLEDDVDHRARSAAGLERARQFTWRRCAEATVAVYRKAAG